MFVPICDYRGDFYARLLNIASLPRESTQIVISRVSGSIFLSGSSFVATPIDT